MPSSLKIGIKLSEDIFNLMDNINALYALVPSSRFEEADEVMDSISDTLTEMVSDGV